MGDAVIVRVSPSIQADFRRRGVFPELQGTPDLHCPVNAIVPKQRAAELLQDAEAQHKVASGSDKKSIRAFVRQLDRLLETPAYFLERRVSEAQGEARERGREWLEKLRGRAEFDRRVVEAVGLHAERCRYELATLGTVNGQRLDKRTRKHVRAIIDQLETIEFERSLAWRLDAATLTLADETIAKARRAASA